MANHEESVLPPKNGEQRDSLSLTDLAKCLQTVEQESGENASDIATQSREIQDLKEEVLLLRNLVLKQNNKIHSLNTEVDDLRSRSMSSNVLLHGIPEHSRENTEEVLMKVLTTTKMNAAEGVHFERVHRIGAFNPQSKTPRPIVAKPLSYKDTQRILNHGRSLPRGPGNPFFTPQTTSRSREQRKKLTSIIDETKTKVGPTNVNAKIIRDKLYINGQLHHDNLPPPSPAAVLQLSSHERHELKKADPQLTHGNMITVCGQTFQATVAEVSSKAEARQAYQKLLTIPLCMGAAHNVAACAFSEGESGPVSREWQDDSEHGAGRFLSNWLKRRNLENIILIVTRKVDQPLHLGQKRFEAYEEAATLAMERLNAATTK